MKVKVVNRKITSEDLGHNALFPQTNNDIIPISENKAYTVNLGEVTRSQEQNEYYWKIVIPTAQYYLDELSHCPNPKSKNDIDNAHYTLKLLYCFEVKPEMAETIQYFCPIKKKLRKRVVPFTAKIDKMSQKKFNGYLDWIKKRVNLASGLHWDRAIQEI